MSVQVRQSDDEITISISGNFDYSIHKDFRSTYNQLGITPKNFIVDLRNAEYMDSSALGMLLLLKEHVDQKGGSISIRNPQPTVRKVLDIANFNRFFDIQ